MLYSIRFNSQHDECQLIGTQTSICIIANLLETIKEKFKVANTSGFQLDQHAFGVGGFEYWLLPEEKFHIKIPERKD